LDEDRHYRRALGAFATGVVLVTADTAKGPVGIIINSFTSVSLEPRLVLWCLGDQSDRYSAFAAAEHWAINVLAFDQHALSARFAAAGSLEAGDVATDRLGVAPALPIAAARFGCRTYERRTLGDHLVIVGQVEAFDLGTGDALTYYRGRYGVASMES
jgi:flavin reductase (DIM6/NTAB) family NADH-FMN oxidoreductase RutF